MLETAMGDLRRTEERLVEPRAEATRNTILDAAERIFAERGFAGTSMRELAREAQTSQALLHHHFGTKAGLYDAVKQRFTDRYNSERRPKVDSNEDLSVVGGAVLGYFEFLRANPNLSRLTSWARLEGDRKPWGGEDEIWHSLLAWAEEAKARGQIRKDVDPKLLLVLGAGAVQFWFDNRDFVCSMLGLDPNEARLDDRYAIHALGVLLFGAAARNDAAPTPAP
jgi:TetR/AcrR family transcriptional regulator